MPFLAAGDCIGIIAPSGVPDANALHAGADAMRRMGYRTKLATNVAAVWPHTEHGGEHKPYNFAGTPAQRAADIHEMFGDDEVKLIVAARGGYGSDDVIPLLDAKLVRNNAKPLMGYSDVTNLLNWLAMQCAVPAWHGPMAARDFAWPGGVDLKSFNAVIANDHVWPLNSVDGLQQVIAGHARGTLRGGCLKVLERAFNAASYSGYTHEQHLNFLEQLDGPTILFLEDINELPHDTRANWLHLKSHIDFKNIRGVVFGYMLVRDRRAEEFIHTIREIFASDGIPVAFGLRSGHLEQDLWPSGQIPQHVQANITLPFGCTVELLCNESATMQIYPYAGAQ